MKAEFAYWQPFVKADQVSQWVSGLDEQLKQATSVRTIPLTSAQGQLATCLTPNSFWIIYTVASGGKIAIRTCFDPQTIHSVTAHKPSDADVEYHIEGSLGSFRVRVELFI